MAEVSITFKAHGGYEAPWIVVRGTDAADASAEVEALRVMGAFGAVKQIAAEFASTPVPEPGAAEAAVRAAFPNATEVQQQAASVPPAQSLPVCETCGGPTKFKSGTSAKGGAYQGYACTADRTHFDHVK